LRGSTLAECTFSPARIDRAKTTAANRKATLPAINLFLVMQIPLSVLRQTDLAIKI